MLSAALSLIHNDTQATETSVTTSDFMDFDNKECAIGILRSKVIRNVAMISPNGSVRYIAAHRSHMSHRSSGGGRGGHSSHASHMSSYRGGSSSHSSHSSSSYRRNSGSSRSSSLYSNPTPTAPKKTIATYSLGDRSLKFGLYGADVTSLTDLLARNGYIRSSWVKKKSGFSQYSTEIVSAIKRFQKDASLKQTGIADANTISRLRMWETDNTTYVLGVRDLSYSENASVSGSDVDELVSLLKKAGYAPDLSKLTKEGGHYVFTQDIAIAVKMFQAFNKIDPTGVVTEDLVKKLKAVVK